MSSENQARDTEPSVLLERFISISLTAGISEAETVVAERAANVIREIPQLVTRGTAYHASTLQRDEPDFDCSVKIMTLNPGESTQERKAHKWTFSRWTILQREPLIPDPTRLRDAARLVYDLCQQAGLNPSLRFGHDWAEGGPADEDDSSYEYTTLELYICWNIPALPNTTMQRFRALLQPEPTEAQTETAAA